MGFVFGRDVVVGLGCEVIEHEAQVVIEVPVDAQGVIVGSTFLYGRAVSI